MSGVLYQMLKLADMIAIKLSKVSTRVSYIEVVNSVIKCCRDVADGLEADWAVQGVVGACGLINVQERKQEIISGAPAAHHIS